MSRELPKLSRLFPLLGMRGVALGVMDIVDIQHSVEVLMEPFRSCNSNQGHLTCVWNLPYATKAGMLLYAGRLAAMTTAIAIMIGISPTLLRRNFPKLLKRSPHQPVTSHERKEPYLQFERHGIGREGDDDNVRLWPARAAIEERSTKREVLRQDRDWSLRRGQAANENEASVNTSQCEVSHLCAQRTYCVDGGVECRRQQIKMVGQ